MFIVDFFTAYKITTVYADKRINPEMESISFSVWERQNGGGGGWSQI
jgi:hypothetical protein